MDNVHCLNRVARHAKRRRKNYENCSRCYSPAYANSNSNFQQQIAHIQSALANTTGNWDAIKKSPAVLYNILQQQSSLLSYVHGFRFCVVVCLVCAALAFLFKKVGKPTGPAAAH